MTREYRDPLLPRVGVLLLGNASDGLLLRWAPSIPFAFPLRISFEIIAGGTIGGEVSYALTEFAAALAGDPLTVDRRYPPPCRMHLPSDAIREGLGLLLAASDRTVNMSGVCPPFSMAKPTEPCPVCKSTSAPPGRSRTCVISSTGAVVCRGQASDEVVRSNQGPIAAVAGCRCPGLLWALAEPAKSRLVVPVGEVWS